MSTALIQRPALTLCGLSIRTNNQQEMHPDTAKIGPLFQRFMQANVAEHIPQRQAPGTLYAAYSDFSQQDQGDYHYWIGELTQATHIENNSELQLLTLPAGPYQRITTATGPLPDIVIQAWQRIW